MLKESSSRKPFTSTIDKEIFIELKTYSDETGIPISKLVDKAFEMYFKNVKKDKPGK